MNITGNTILITGGGTGIGRGLAEALHAEGNTIVIAGRRRAPLEDVCAANDAMAWIELDVADPADIARVAEKLAADHPALNVVVHNAGIMKAEDMTADPYDLAQAEATIATNLLGPIRLTTALLPQFKAQESATIITVSSGLASVPLVYTPTYGATKAAIHSWSQSLRSQFDGTGIDVIELVPPQVATDLMPGQVDDPGAMPLDAFIAEVIALLKANPRGPEILVDKVKLLRNAEAEGRYDKTYAMLNANHRLAK
ncbi:SDR family oxidoreductase [Sphingomonas oligophenolica]|uniref:SDR family NAD(P)-dependent oxidoreductase n=1 Tax=Sphingomonas oligophenolica TaxID=301154 RepID=A0A502C9Y0_9SPHN|nr:SDR family NAD(P)-dependent oxidoreductase [Sphingomonas oligophenolica]TPG09653.1 SDR family NAD(P)-dependent oxidoreductase [Sphingomonas oligophenolica]